jgi:flagella basal body P-ring formation protein FlgA
MKKKIIYFILLFSKLASAEISTEDSSQINNKNSCKIELFSKIYKLEPSRQLNANDIIKEGNCEKNISVRLSQIISNSSGTMGIDFLKREIEKEFANYKIEITPRKISLFELNLVLRDQLMVNGNFFFNNTKSLNAVASIGLTEGEQLKVYCESCNNLGEKNVKIDIINSLESSTRTLWFTTQAMAKIKVFKAKRNLSFQQKNLLKEDFYSEEIFTSNPDNALTSINDINFYKSNRTILQGSTVSNFDLQPVNLINFGTPVTVILMSQNIYLQKKAMPQRSAQFGETVELINPNSHKIISGKVVDYNKVVIEL